MIGIAPTAGLCASCSSAAAARRCATPPRCAQCSRTSSAHRGRCAGSTSAPASASSSKCCRRCCLPAARSWALSRWRRKSPKRRRAACRSIRPISRRPAAGSTWSRWSTCSRTFRIPYRSPFRRLLLRTRVPEAPLRRAPWHPLHGLDAN